MNNKVIVKVIVPEIFQTYDVFLPINKKIGNIVILLNKAINELSENCFPISNCNVLYNVKTRTIYKSDVLLLNTDIRNGSELVLLNML